MEAFNFTVGNEDCCCYTFDMRKLTIARSVHKDFVSAVMDVRAKWADVIHLHSSSASTPASPFCHALFCSVCCARA